MWISPEFAVQVMDWIFRLLSGDLTLVEDLVERHEAANAGVQVMATVTAAGIHRHVPKDIDFKSHCCDFLFSNMIGNTPPP